MNWGQFKDYVSYMCHDGPKIGFVSPLLGTPCLQPSGQAPAVSRVPLKCCATDIAIEWLHP